MTPATSFMSDDPNEVTHRTKGFALVRRLLALVVDCVHLVSPLRLPHRLTPRDSFVQSFAYDPAGRRLEIRYRWKSAAQFSPISPGMVQQLAGRADVHALLAEWIKQRRIPAKKSERRERSWRPCCADSEWWSSEWSMLVELQLRTCPSTRFYVQ